MISQYRANIANVVKSIFVLIGVLFVASSFTNAYLSDVATSSGNSFATSMASPNDVKLNEIYANPTNNNPLDPSDESNGEWLEIYNTSDWSWDVNGWRLEDAAHKSIIVDASKTGGSTVVPAHGWLVVNRNGDPNFSLNNGSETVYLYDGGMLIDSFHYTTTTETKSWGRKPDGLGTWFSDLTPSPGGTNGL